MVQSWASSDATRRSMQGNTSRDTGPELATRRLVHAMGLRYRVDYRPELAVRTRPDLTFTGSKVAVFIDGCFWHGCPMHHTQSKTNAEYWAAKVEANRERDARNTASLQTLGWSVLRFWEHEQPEHVAVSIAKVVRNEAPK